MYLAVWRLSTAKAGVWLSPWDLADRVFPQFADCRTWAGKARRVIPIVQLVPRQLD